MNDSVQVYVGADRSQALAIKVLEHSIKRFTDLPVEVHAMIDMPNPVPKDPKQRQRTGFSFSRFCIPKLAGYKGRAIYMDADMQVFKDIRELWEMPFYGAKVLIQDDLDEFQTQGRKDGAPPRRIKQCAVMVLDCKNLDWDIERIVQGLDDGDYNYENLLYEMCLLKEGEIGYTVPFEWNSLEHFDEATALIHYTDMNTQPWVSTKNPLDYIWYSELKLMLENGSLSLEEIQREIDLGYFRPSLIRDVLYSRWVPKPAKPIWRKMNQFLDHKKGYVAHKVVNEAMKGRREAVRQFHAQNTSF